MIPKTTLLIWTIGFIVSATCLLAGTIHFFEQKRDTGYTTYKIETISDNGSFPINAN